MARRRAADRLEEELAELRTLAQAGPSPALETALRRALAERSSFVAGAAAKWVGDLRLASLTDDLVAAFRRFLVDPGQTDKGCLAKLPIVEALLALGHRGAEVYLAGIRHRQPEPIWGPPGDNHVDTAANLRATCAVALGFIGWPDARHELVRLLADPEPQPRAAAVAELAARGSDSDLHLLHLLLLLGNPDDDDQELRGDCMRALLQSPERYLPEVAACLDHPDSRLSQLAALAIGESRVPGGYLLLLAVWERHLLARDRQPLVLPLALTRDPAAFDLLVDRLRAPLDPLAGDIVNALWVCFPDPDHRARLRAAATAHPVLSRLLADLQSQTD